MYAKPFSSRISTGSHLFSLLLAAALLALLALGLTASLSARAANPPIVNGLFYGDGDDETYWLHNVSENGSKLYLYFDDPVLYVALVVDRSVNDNVFSPSSNSAYTNSAGWNSPNHTLPNLINSEFFAFTLACTTPPLSWTWQQGYAEKIGGDWESSHETGAGTGTPPPGFTSSSSLAWNLNHYEDDNPSPEWDMYALGAEMSNWKSPFDTSDPNTVPGLDGYPATGDIVYSEFYEWEWPMVYEWSVDMAAAGCGNNPFFVQTGDSHHSPSKNGDENDTFPECEGDECILKDWGDLPDSYSTLEASNGPRHPFVVNNPHLGPLADPEDDGQPNPSATGDDVHNDNDDDGVTRDLGTSWDNDASVNIDFDVMCAGTNADLAVWIDWDNDGSFQADEFYTFPDVPCNAVYTGAITVPGESDYTVGTSVHVRVRIFGDGSNAPGGSLDSGDYAGAATSGEVEDYIWDFTPTAITLEQISAVSSGGLHPVLLAGLLVLLAASGYLLLRTSRRRPADPDMQ